MRVEPQVVQKAEMSKRENGFPWRHLGFFYLLFGLRKVCIVRTSPRGCLIGRAF
jgi:hypothetical protein